MSTFTKFAIVGAGGLGSTVVDGLLKANAAVTILTRDDTKAELQPFQKRGAILAKVDYENEASLQAALAGKEVVVSTINAFHHANQLVIARAAKAAGVELFVPTEYGTPQVDGPQIMKQKVRDLLRELDLPSALFHSGLWAEYITYFLGNFMEGTINVIGDGNGKMSIVSRSDLGRFMVHVLTTASKPSLTWSRFSVESDRMSPNEIAAVAEKKLGKKLKINVVSYDETKKNYDTDAVANILTNIADGRLVTGTEEEAKDTVAKFFPEWDPTPYEAFIA